MNNKQQERAYNIFAKWARENLSFNISFKQWKRFRHMSRPELLRNDPKWMLNDKGEPHYVLLPPLNAAYKTLHIKDPRTGVTIPNPIDIIRRMDQILREFITRRRVHKYYDLISVHPLFTEYFVQCYTWYALYDDLTAWETHWNSIDIIGNEDVVGKPISTLLVNLHYKYPEITAPDGYYRSKGVSKKDGVWYAIELENGYMIEAPWSGEYLKPNRWVKEPKGSMLFEDVVNIIKNNGSLDGFKLL